MIPILERIEDLRDILLSTGECHFMSRVLRFLLQQNYGNETKHVTIVI